MSRLVQGLNRTFGSRFSCLLVILLCAGLLGCPIGGGEGEGEGEGALEGLGEGEGEGLGEGEGAGEKPASLPAYTDLDLYSSESPLNQKIPLDAELEPDSEAYVALIAEAGDEGGFMIELKQYTCTVFFADANTPRRDVWISCGEQWWGGMVSYLRNVPIPDFAEPTMDIDGADSPIIPGECGAESAQDNQMVILDREARCEYDLFQARIEDGEWVASWINSISMDSIGIYEHGMSSRGSGFTTLAGLIWPDELEAGQIDHALIFSYPYAKAGGPIAPASESDGISTEPNALPEGARLRLDPTLDLDTLGLTAPEKTIAKALQEYGMFLVDDGAFGVSIEAVNPLSVQGNPYAGLLPDEDFPELNNIPLDKLQLLKMGAQDPLADENHAMVASGCGTME